MRERQPSPEDRDELDIEEVLRHWRELWAVDLGNWRQWFPGYNPSAYPGPGKWSPSYPWPGSPAVVQCGSPELDDGWTLTDAQADQLAAEAATRDYPPFDCCSQPNWRWQ